MQIPHQTYKIDLNNINEPLTRMIESVNDKGVRFVDVELWANSQKVTLPQNCTATAAFVTDGFLINESVECAISDDLTTVIVPIDNANIESKSGIMLVEIKITENGNILTPPFAFKVRVKKSITEDANIFEKSYGTVSEILKEVAEARGDSKTLKDEIATKADKTEVDTALATKADKSTTYTKTEVDTALATKPSFDDVYTVEEADDHFLSKHDAGNTYATKAELVTKANKETTYTKVEVDTALAGKLDNTAGSVTTDNIASKAVTTDKIANGAITALKLANGAVSSSTIATNQINTNHLQSGAVTSDKLSDEVKTSINGKYDSANVETGSGSLTVNTQSAIDSGLVKTCTFKYQKTGKTVNIFVNVVFNEGSISYLQFTGLPFTGESTSDQNRNVSATNKNTQVIVYPVGSWLTLNFNGTKALAQDETFKSVITIQIS